MQNTGTMTSDVMRCGVRESSSIARFEGCMMLPWLK